MYSLWFYIEECGETLQCIGKILRHGYESTHPDGGPTNRQMLETELADVGVATTMLITADNAVYRTALPRGDVTKEHAETGRR